ncbi:MAG TPA: FAD-dependent oxidoreductase [Candidatus Saccharimonadales bacterium]|nr:FAD-dependent oxidoreductase [Candidatus Saccharimonadales bacterium]
MTERKIYTARLKHAVWLSEQARHLEFAVEGQQHFEFTPGQFLSLLAKKEGREITRAYSIASAPYPNAQFDLCLNRVDDGFFSNLLCDLREGDTVQFHGPHGMFTLRTPLRDAIFVCTGTGVAPIRGFVQWLFSNPQRAQGREFWLVYGTRHEDALYYRDYFEKVAAANSNFHYVPTLSRGTNDWGGGRGYVQDHVRKIVECLPTGSQNSERQNDLDAYICGLNAMVKANRQLLKELGFDKKQIVYERYD